MGVFRVYETALRVSSTSLRPVPALAKDAMRAVWSEEMQPGQKVEARIVRELHRMAIDLRLLE